MSRLLPFRNTLQAGRGVYCHQAQRQKLTSIFLHSDIISVFVREVCWPETDIVWQLGWR